MPVADSPRDVGTGDSAPIIKAPPQDPTGIFDNLAAGYKAARVGPASTFSHQNTAESVYYDQIVKALNSRGRRATDEIEVRPNAFGYTGPKGLIPNAQGVAMAPSSPREFRNPYGSPTTLGMGNPLGWGRREAEQLWAAVAEERRRDPSFMKDLPDAAAIKSRAVQDRQKQLDQAEGVMSRATLPGQIAGFIGGVAAAPFEPESYVGGGGGAAGKTIARTILKRAVEEGAVNAVSGAVGVVGMTRDAATLERPMTTDDIIQNVGEQAVFGSVFGGVTASAPHVLAPVGKAAARVADNALSHLPQPVKDAAMAASLRAGTVDDRALLHEARKAHAPFSVESTATPDERQALHVTERDADVREASPLHSSGASPHENRLKVAMQSLGVSDDPPIMPSPAPLPAPVKPASYIEGINRAEGTAQNKQSSAYGTGQFLKGTWLDLYKRHYGASGLSDAEILAKRADPELGRRMIQIYGDENGRYLRSRGLEDSNGNRSLAHFLGAGDAAKVLRAGPSTPVESLLSAEVIAANRSVLAGKSASEVVAWAHKRVGAASGEPVARPDSVPEVDWSDDAVPTYAPAVEHRTFDPADLITDATSMQYKSGGDASGVTDRLQGVEQWNPLLSGKIVAWERADGQHVIVDGHQRLGLAQRISQADPSQNVRLDAVVIRELDGVSAQMARVIGALKNIAEGTGSVVDAARVLRDAPNGMAQLPPRAGNVRTLHGLVSLSNDAYGAVLNNVIDPEMAAQIGRIAGDRPEAHMSLIDLLHQSDVRTPGQADTVIRQALADGFGRADEAQLGMFGDMPEQSLYGPAAKVLDAAKRQIRSEKRTFKTLTGDANRIEGAGNQLDRQANEAKVSNSDTAIAILDATAHSSGPVRDALLAAAQQHLDGNRTGAVRKFLDDISGIDLQSAARGVSDSAGNGGLSDRSGSAFDLGEADAELADGRGLPGGPTAYDEAVAAGNASLDFSEPVGPHAERQTALVEHNLKLDAPEAVDAKAQPTFRLSDEGDEISFTDAAASADSDIAAIEALKGCL